MLNLKRLIPNGQIFNAPLSVYLDDENIPAPDVMWIAEGGKCKVGEKYLEGPPDLIVEILSPSTARYDKTVKFLMYEKFGVREYWTADPNQQQVEVWCLKGPEYELQGTYGKTDAFESPVLNAAKLDLALIFA